MASIGDLWIRLRSDDGKYKQDLVKTTEKAGAEAGAKGGKRMATGIRDSLKKHSTLIATGAGAALGTFVAGAAQDFAKFETSMNEVFTLLPDISQDAMDDMEDQVKQFSTEFGKLPEEVVPALYQSLSAGVPQDNVFEFLETANKLAVGGVAETSEAVGLLATITKGYGDTSEEATKQASDMLFTTVKLGTTTIPELARALGKAVPQAAALNVAQEELLGTTAALTGVTGNTAEVATQMKAVFTSLLNPTAQMKAGLKEMGFESGEAAIEALGLQGTLEGLGATTDGDTAKFAKMLGSSEALTAGLAITGQRADAVRTNIAEMGDSAGATDVAFERMDSGVQAAANRIAAKMKVMSLAVGEAIAPIGPILTAFGPTMGRALGGALGGAFGFVTTKIPALMSRMVAKIGAVMAGSAMVNSITTGLGNSMQQGFAKMGGLAGGRFGTFFKVGAAVGIAALFVAVWDQWNKLQASVKEGQENLQSSADDALTLSGNEAIKALENTSRTLGDLNPFQRALADTAGNEQILNGLQNLGQSIIRETELTAEQLEQAALALEGGARDAFARGGDAIGNELLRAADVMRQRTPVLASAIEDGVSEAVTDGVTDGADDAADAMQAEINAEVEAAMKAAGIPMGEALADGAGEGVALNIDDAIAGGFDAIHGGSTNIVEAFSGLGTEASTAFADAISSGNMTTAFAGLSDEMRAALEPMVPVVKEQMALVRAEARHQSVLMGTGIRAGLKQARGVVKEAMADLRFAMTKPMKAMKVVARIEGALTGERLAKGLASKDPFLRRQAELSRATLIEEWENMSGEAWDHGKTTGENVGKGIKSRRRAARRAARDGILHPVTGVLMTLEEHAKEFGEGTTENYAEGIEDPDAVADVKGAVRTAVKPVRRGMRVLSPAEEGDLSTFGGPEGWGQRLIASFRKGMLAETGRGGDISDALGLTSLGRVAPMLANSAPSVAPAAAGGGGGMTMNLDVRGLPMRARTPLEVSQQVARAARLGVLAPARPDEKFEER